MKLVSQGFGYRLVMSADQKFRLSESLLVYKGLVAKMMVLTGLAFRQQIIDKEGKIHSLAIWKRSLGHYVWRHNRLCDQSVQLYHQNMEKFYITRNRLHKKFTTETTYQLGLRKLNIFNPNQIDFITFKDKVQRQAPLKGRFYKIVKNQKTAGYLLGTIHVGNELLMNLNPLINKKLKKAKIVAFEASYKKMGRDERERIINEAMINPHMPKSKRTHYAMKIREIAKQAGFYFKYGVESCLFKKVQELREPKQFVALEKDHDLEFTHFIEKYPLDTCFPLIKIISALALPGIYRNYLAGTIRGKKDEDLQRRDFNMAKAAKTYLQDKRTLIAIGAFHIDGVKSHLEKEGFILTRI